jgi:competence protein ComEC
VPPLAPGDVVAPVGLVPALAVVAGAAAAILIARVAMAGGALTALAVAGWISWYIDRRRLTTALVAAAFFCASAALGVAARDAALYTPLRAALDRAFGGFDLRTAGPGGRHDPVAVRAQLLEDAAPEDGFIALRARITAIRLDGRWRSAAGGVTLAVGGAPSPARADQWRAGRTIETFAAFRRPARYLNDGVPDFERQLALDGTALFGSVKSALLVDVVGHGSLLQESAARVREHVRRRIDRWVGPYDPVSAAIVTAVLIGDRTGLPDPIRLRLQAAGTYHVIAISGGNIAILAALTLAVLLVCGVSGRPAALATLLLLVAYAQVVTTGASVWRATVMAVVYLGARLLDHRTPPWQAMAVAAALVLCVRPLDVRDAGFILTFGATAALLEAAQRIARAVPRWRAAAWLVGSLAASAAVELTLMPVNASIFSRVTAAGLVLNLIAVPLMGLVQVAGLASVLAGGVEWVAAPAGWVAHAAADALVESARLVEAAPWLAVRVPRPPVGLTAMYYAALAAILMGRGIVRAGGAVALAAAGAAILIGHPGAWMPSEQPALRVTAFDVGQGDATLVQFPDQSTLLVDAGGIPFGGGSFDVGARVLAPALWARGVRRLDTLLLTHGDPDHIGGARTLLSGFTPSRVWEGTPVGRHGALSTVLEAARDTGAGVERRRAGETLDAGGVRVRVLHPPAPDWERRRVRNDDSVVLELLYGEVAVLLPGDIGAGVERGLVGQLTPARVRILKVAHHGSRTSTSRELVEGWRPHIALISAGRGNTFGHPAPEVLQRLEAVGATVYRTDLHGQITIDTDGERVDVRTYVANH